MSKDNLIDINSLSTIYQEKDAEINILKVQVKEKTEEFNALKYKNHELQQKFDMNMQSFNILQKQHAILVETNKKLEQKIVGNNDNYKKGEMKVELAKGTIDYLKTTLEKSEKERNEYSQKNESLNSKNKQLKIAFDEVFQELNALNQKVDETINTKINPLELKNKELQEIINSMNNSDEILAAFGVIKNEFTILQEKYHLEELKVLQYKTKYDQLATLLENGISKEDTYFVNLWKEKFVACENIIKELREENQLLLETVSNISN